MEPSWQDTRLRLEADLFAKCGGGALLDALVQANLDLNRLSPDELRGMVDRYTSGGLASRWFPRQLAGSR